MGQEGTMKRRLVWLHRFGKVIYRALAAVAVAIDPVIHIAKPSLSGRAFVLFTNTEDCLSMFLLSPLPLLAQQHATLRPMEGIITRHHL